MLPLSVSAPGAAKEYCARIAPRIACRHGGRGAVVGDGFDVGNAVEIVGEVDQLSSEFRVPSSELIEAQARIVIVGGADAIAIVNLPQLVGRLIDDIGNDRAGRPAGDAPEEISGVVKVADLVVVRVSKRGDAVEGIVGEGSA